MTPLELNNSIMEIINENEFTLEISDIIHNLAQRVGLLTSIRGSAVSELCLEALRGIIEEDNTNLPSIQLVVSALWLAASNNPNEYINTENWRHLLGINPTINIVSDDDLTSDSDDSTIMYFTDTQYNNPNINIFHQNAAFFNIGEQKALNTMDAELNNIFSHPFTVDSGNMEQLFIVVVPFEIASLGFEQFNEMISTIYNWFSENTTTD